MLACHVFLTHRFSRAIGARLPSCPMVFDRFDWVLTQHKHDPFCATLRTHIAHPRGAPSQPLHTLARKCAHARVMRTPHLLGFLRCVGQRLEADAHRMTTTTTTQAKDTSTCQRDPHANETASTNRHACASTNEEQCGQCAPRQRMVLWQASSHHQWEAQTPWVVPIH